VNGHELRGRLDRHGVRDLSAHVAALRDVSRVPQAPHQHDPGARHAGMIPAGRRRLAREPITGDRRDHDVEGVLRAAAEGRGVGERADELDLLEDRAGPSVRDDDGQRALVLRTHVDEVDVEPVDLGGELGQGVELRLALAPVVVRRPVAREVLERRERHALRRVGDGLLLRPPRRRDAAFHVGERLVRKVDAEGADGVGAAPCLGFSLPGGAPARRGPGLGFHLCLSHGDRSAYEKCDSCPPAFHGFPPLVPSEFSSSHSGRTRRQVQCPGLSVALALDLDRRCRGRHNPSPGHARVPA
jgi:hypothetical protein